CTVTASGLSTSGSLPASATLTVQYLAQVPEVPGGTTVTASSSATLGGNIVQPDPLVVIQSVNCLAVGPGNFFPATAALSDQKAGSVPFYNLYDSSATNASAQNTRISITNVNSSLDTAVHLFFVDRTSCSVADSFICLTPNQTAAFLVSDLDP